MITNGTGVRDEVKLGLHQVVVQKDGYMTYTDLVEGLLTGLAIGLVLVLRRCI